jgi:hypothetical protein
MVPNCTAARVIGSSKLHPRERNTAQRSVARICTPHAYGPPPSVSHRYSRQPYRCSVHRVHEHGTRYVMSHRTRALDAKISGVRKQQQKHPVCVAEPYTQQKHPVCVAEPCTQQKHPVCVAEPCTQHTSFIKDTHFVSIQIAILRVNAASYSSHFHTRRLVTKPPADSLNSK